MYFTNRRILYIIGMLGDKDFPKVLTKMMPLAEEVFVLTPENPRALKKEDLKEAILAQFPELSVTETEGPKEALTLAREKAEAQDVIVAFGSFTFLGELMEELQKA